MIKDFEETKKDLINEIKSLGLTNSNNQIFVFSNPALAEQIYLSLELLDKCKSLVHFPHSETLPYDFFSPPAMIRARRIRSLAKLTYEDNLTLVTSIQALMSPCAEMQHVNHIDNLEVGKRIYRKKFITSLVNNGYVQKGVVNNNGEFSLRGSVIDFFSSNLAKPARIEIFQDRIESLRLFNPDTQLTIKKVNKLSTLPVFEYPLDKKSISEFVENWRNAFSNSYENDSEIFRKLNQSKPSNGAEIYLPLFYGKKVTLLSFLNKFSKLVIDKKVFSSAKNFSDLINSRYEEYKYDLHRPILPPNSLFLTNNEIKKVLDRKNVLTLKQRIPDKEKLPLINKKSFPLNEKSTLKNSLISLPEIGKRIVHLSYGIGIFRGLKQIEAKGIINECVEVEYRNNGKVFVPIESINLISKYFGPEDISLDQISSKVWKKRKNQALKRSFDVAAELIEVQAKRNAFQGIKYIIPNEYKYFISKFPYQETPDQLSSMKEVEDDLLKEKPMERLVCGEVGFGKTEIAMRASFIASYNNKQTCILVPTTLLAQQHLYSFKKRFEDTPINISSITRNLKTKDRTKLLSDLNKGNIDILIGTHALLQDSLSYHNLGLLIIDEEHKFGVRQKEKIKRFKKNINVLSLSATPIPRSLHFALSELRDFSIIASPPPDRISVKTFVYSLNKNLIKEAIQREILRGGQVYYLCNDLRLINNRKESLEEQFPDLLIGIVHGKLRSKEIEKAMLDFQAGRIDILVCSTIIESGIDISNANTLIVESAEKLGLAQLHQLRGRVGRGNKQAYAYFLKSSFNIKRKKAKSRLEALIDSDSLSAGFLLAIKDLEIRGAGEILGVNQSGIFESIGLDLYTRLLRKATDYIKNGIFDFNFLEKEIHINLGVSAYIPDSYLPDLNQRLIMYNKISLAISEEELKKIQLEMIDRFGLIPQETKFLFLQNEVKLLAENKSISYINVDKDKITFKSDKANLIKTFTAPKSIDNCVDTIKKEILYLENNI